MLHHASCIAWNGEAVLIAGAPGTGKSTLALHCIEAGASLVSDDQTILKREGGMLVASAPETIAGYLSLRMVGTLRLPHAPHASVRCVIEIESLTPGWSEAMIEGIGLPKLALPEGYRITSALVRHLLLSFDGTRPDIWLAAEDWRPERLSA